MSVYHMCSVLTCRQLDTIDHSDFCTCMCACDCVCACYVCMCMCVSVYIRVCVCVCVHVVMGISAYTSGLSHTGHMVALYLCIA